MTTQTPFQNNSTNNLSGNLEKFPLRTMKDDLLTLQTQGTLKESTTAQKTSTPQTPTPFSSTFEKQEMKAPKEIISPIQPTSTIRVESQSKIVEVPKSENRNENTPSSSIAYKLTMYAIVVLVILIVGLSGYYFWMTNNKQATPVVTQTPIEVIPEPVVEPTEPVITIPVEKYSQDKPNYLPIDLTASPAENIQIALSTAAIDIKKTNSQKPFEFVIVDSNNNPIVFSAFATAAKMSLSESLMNTLSDSFSIFLYNDNQTIKAGISINIIKTNLIATELAKQEKTFIPAILPLFLNEKTETLVGEFASSTYNNANIRYLNASTAKNLSVDYAVFNSKLVIGTSKNTLRSILDKISAAAPQN